MPSFLMEIGSEELPARFLPSAENNLARLFEEALKDRNLAFESINTMSTPRRLVIQINGLATSQPEYEEVVMGPPAKIAFDGDGRPTKALAGFAKASDVAMDRLFRLETPKGEYMAFRRQAGGMPARKILEEILPEIIKNLPFQKSMHWGSNKITYARPVKWILALLDDEIVPFSVGPVQSGRLTQGHRIHAGKTITIPHARDYDRLIREDGAIEPDSHQRRKLILDLGDKLASKYGGKVIWKDGLLDEVAGLVEHPVPIIGDFDAAYLAIPDEVLLTSMESHQKSFGLRDGEGKLLPHFLTTLNIDPLDVALVKNGWEKVLKARLEDARFFWETDLKDTFDNWLAKLDKVIFIGKLGSMGDKSRRLEDLCGWLASQVDPFLNENLARQAGKYAKADLVSGMVGEFDTLQGVMGGIYAEKAGMDPSVAKAIGEQYLPSGPDSPVPSTLLGGLLSIADKADTLTGCFALGKIPTGVADPDGLRRCALGIIRIVLHYNINLSLRKIFDKSLDLYHAIKFKFSRDEILDNLDKFLKNRLRHYFINQGYGTVLVDAVLANDFYDLTDCKARLDAMTAFESSPEHEQSAQILKRIENITRKENVSQGLWNTDLLQDAAERNLADFLADFLPEVDKNLADKKYGEALIKLNALKKPVSEFFDAVLVLAEDPAIRENRLKLISNIASRYSQIAQFSLLQI